VHQSPPSVPSRCRTSSASNLPPIGVHRSAVDLPVPRLSVLASDLAPSRQEVAETPAHRDVTRADDEPTSSSACALSALIDANRTDSFFRIGSG
jgi:hypothetical protein